jgi:hypothetical protein
VSLSEVQGGQNGDIHSEEKRCELTQLGKGRAIVLNPIAQRLEI